mmetsp:Transcript_10757/g.19491  ORF Transcript_10757/g.19491 Transcript_10757/m.19491 type:complete len:97 (+) Transcript_10757:447-737(+)
MFQPQPSSYIGVRMEYYLMMHCMRLKGLIVKNATLYPEGNTIHTFPVSQEMLIKMVRNHQTLQWFRSDLSAANVAMLQQERPEITFVLDYTIITRC